VTFGIEETGGRTSLFVQDTASACRRSIWPGLESASTALTRPFAHHGRHRAGLAIVKHLVKAMDGI